jgi:hypothetical protein
MFFPLFPVYLLPVTTYTLNTASEKNTSSGIDDHLLFMSPRFQVTVLGPRSPRWKDALNMAPGTEGQAWHDMNKGWISPMSFSKFVVLRISSISTLLLVNFHYVFSLSNFSCSLLLNS